MSAGTFAPSQDEEEPGQRKLRSWSGLARLMLVASSTHCTADLGSEMETRDMLISIVGYLLFVAMAVALLAGVMASF